MEANLENPIPTKRKLNANDVVMRGFLWVVLLTVIGTGVYLVGKDPHRADLSSLERLERESLRLPSTPLSPPTPGSATN